MKELKAWFITDDEDGDGLGYAFIAESLNEAIAFAQNEIHHFVTIIGDCQITGWECKKCDISGLNKGDMVGLDDGLKRGVYAYSLHEDFCPHCEQETMYLMYSRKEQRYYCENDGCRLDD